jgi:hypothetical protein
MTRFDHLISLTWRAWYLVLPPRPLGNPDAITIVGAGGRQQRIILKQTGG